MSGYDTLNVDYSAYDTQVKHNADVRNLDTRICIN